MGRDVMMREDFQALASAPDRFMLAGEVVRAE